LSLFQGIRYFLLADDNKGKILKKVLGFYPSNISLYEQAFRHKSIANEFNEESLESNERLEFLGDAVLGSIISEYFFVKFPFKDEGFLTKIRSKIVNRNFLNQLSIEIGLDTFLETSADTKRSQSIFGDAFEALIGAIYLDKGYESAKKFVIDKVIKDYIDIEKVQNLETNFKSKLIEWSQQTKKAYSFKTDFIENGQSNYFSCRLYIEDIEVSNGTGQSKKKAEQAASQEFFEKNIMQEHS